MTLLKERNTTDIVVILMTGMVGVVLLLATLGIIIGKIVNPESDISAGSEAVGNITTTIVGALMGFIGGRATGKLEANGVK